jgi:hypothetical protein
MSHKFKLEEQDKYLISNFSCKDFNAVQKTAGEQELSETDFYIKTMDSLLKENQTKQEKKKMEIQQNKRLLTDSELKDLER